MDILVKKSRVTLLTQMTLLIIVVVLISTLLVRSYFHLLDDIVENNMGKQAMTVAKRTAQNSISNTVPTK